MKITPEVELLSNSRYWEKEYFNTNLEEFKVLYPNGTSDYSQRDDFDGV